VAGEAVASESAALVFVVARFGVAVGVAAVARLAAAVAAAVAAGL
jgi:hypothetical protein